MSEENKNENKENIQNPETEDKSKQPNKEKGSPNENWNNDDRLDENGNPKKKEDEPSTNKKVEKEEPNKEVHKAANQIEGFLEEAGLKPVEVAKLVSENDGITPEILKALIDKHGESVANLIADKIKGLHESSKNAAKERDAALFEQVHEAFNDSQGGEATFRELATWAKTNIDNKDRIEINGMLAKGGLAAKLAMQELITTFKESNDYTQEAQLEIADGVSDLSSGQALDKKSYQKELRKLKTTGHVYGESKEMEALDRRRMKAIKRGQ